MVTTAYSSGPTSGAELLSVYTRRSVHAAAAPGLLQPMPHRPSHLLPPPVGVMMEPTSQQQKRSPLLCGYPSKKCWSWRVEKRNGELHKFCEYHRQKANTNQRRMEQRRKQGRPASPRGNAGKGNGNSSPRSKSLKVSCEAKPDVVIKLERTPSSKSMVPSSCSLSAAASTSGSPRGIDCFDNGSSICGDAMAAYSWMDVDLDIGIGMDAAVEYMMVDNAGIDMEPSDKPVDLYEEDLYFLEHFIAEISHSVV
ncbi:hypothetical protein BBJ28_00011532 [Nothophytophthora sp. Chile5]|nr:hypothetical protein BBJ28_00011532 [Nothophytophthora sp. Chile5]